MNGDDFLNTYEEYIINWAILGVEDELDEKDLPKAKVFFLNKIKELKKELVRMAVILEKNCLGEREYLILNLMMLGLGRNRICYALNQFDVKRENVEEVRDLCGLQDSKERIENEKYITSLRWATKTRAKWKMMINDKKWEKIKQEYSEGKSPINIGSKYGVSGHIISMRLKDEGLFDESRSTLTRNEIAEKQFEQIDNNLIIQLVEENKYEPVVNIWRLAQVHYPWLLRRQFLDKLSELGLERAEEEINVLKTSKARPYGEKHHYEIKPYIIEAIEEVLGPVEELQKKYSDSSIKEFISLTKETNEKNSKKVYVSERQLHRVITNDPNFKRNTSIEQSLFYQAIKKIFYKEEVFEEYRFNGDVKRFDIFIKSLNVAIDFNGDYWHSDEIIGENYGISSKEHHEKRAELLKEKGVKLIYVWSSDWKKNKEEILKLLRKKEWDNPIFNKYEKPIGFSKNS